MADKVVVDYVILEGYDTSILMEKVNNYLPGMWEPWGNLTYNGQFFYQAMVRYIYPPEWTIVDKRMEEDKKATEFIENVLASHRMIPE